MEAELSTRLLSSLENMGFPLDSARAAVNRVKANHKANTASFDEALDSALQSLIDYEPTDSAQTTSDQGGSENGYGSGRIGSLDGSFQQTSADSLPEVIPSSRMRSLLSDLKGRMDHSIKAFASVPSTTSATPSKNLSPPISDSIERVIADTFVVGSLPSTPLLGTPRIKPSHTPILKHSNKSPFYPSSTPQKSLSPSNTIKRVRFELSKPSTSKSLPTTLEQSSSSSQSEQPQQVPPTPVESPPIQAEPRQKYTLQQLYDNYHSLLIHHGEMPIEAIPTLLETCTSPTLTNLDLTGTTLSLKNSHSLRDFLALDFGLRQLRLCDCGLTDAVVSVLMQGLMDGGNELAWLSLAGNRNVRGEGIKAVSRFLEKSRSLRYLDLSEIPIDANSATQISQSLSMNPYIPLEIIKLESCCIRSNELANLLPGLTAAPLTHLNLRGNKMPYDCTQPLSSLLAFTRTLTHLDLCGNNLKLSIGTLTSSLHGNKTLLFLSLRKNNLDEKSLIDIAQLMTLNRTLKCLDLSCNNFGAKNLVLATNALHKIITASPCLQELSISNSNLNCDGIICIFEAAVATTGLRRLDVSLNPIERRGVVAALDGVRGCKGLISVEVVPILDTAGNCINDVDLSVLAKEIKEQCAVNRDVLMAKREKRPVLESTDSFLESQFSLISAPAEKKLSDLDPTPLSASEELISESIVHNSSMVESPTTVNSTFKESSKAESSLCEGPKFSLIKFQHEILEAEEICIVLEEMLDQVQKCVTHQTGESSEAVPIDGDIMQEFYSKTKTFRPRLSYLIRSNTIQDEETLCASLGLHDRIEKVLAAYDHVVNALSSQKVMEPLSTTSLQRKGSSSKEMESLKSKHSESESQQRGIGSNFKNSTMAWFDKARDALTLRKASPSEKRQTPSSNLSAEEQSTLLLALSPSKVQVLPTQTPITQISSVYTTFSEPFAVPHFMSSEYQKSPATLSVDDSHDTLLHSYSPTDSLQRPPRMESSTSDSSDFNPAVPPTQLLFPKKTKALEERGSRSNTLCVANETPRARGFSVTSFDDVMDGTTEDSARKYMDDGFLAELDSQMKEIDEFLSSTHIPPMNQ